MTQAVIIAGGKGERLRPLTYEIAKSLIPVQGRTLIDHVMDLFWKHQAYEIWLSLGHMQEQIRDKYSATPFWVDNDTNSGKIIPLGTGGWLNRLAASKFRKNFSSDFFVCNSDNLFDLDLKEMTEQHQKSKNVVTIACTRVKDIRAYGSVAIKNDKIVNFEEKKKCRIKQSGWINGGYYLFSPKVFKYVRELKIDLNNPLSLERDLFPVLAKEGLLGAYKSEGQWFDTGTFERWEKVLKEWRGIR